MLPVTDRRSPVNEPPVRPSPVDKAKVEVINTAVRSLIRLIKTLSLHGGVHGSPGATSTTADPQAPIRKFRVLQD
ncbi:protein of unknown function [Nitrospira japonica]|uniref:Uncharacterized protein n=1 Tax=Nitrospira japonica TaxID=1325564 RepID=A0A1W1I7X7_9BACT|nr:protein of unknown function [Nitrospira japonica]